MQSCVKQLDPTRPVTYAAPQGDTFDGINGVIEVRGWNYHPGAEMDRYHAKHPEQPNVGTEQASTVSTRGIYENDQQRGYVSAYDLNAPVGRRPPRLVELFRRTPVVERWLRLDGL